MKRILLALSLLLAAPAAAQQPVIQSGLVTPGHLPAWVTNGVLGDGGTAQTPVITSVGTIGQGNTICASTGPQTGPYNQLCLGVNLNSAAQIVLNTFGGAPAQTLQFVLNGTTYSFPFTATGVVGPGTTIVADAACWNNTAGTLLSDCGVPVTLSATQTWTGPQTFTNSDLLLLGSSTGKTTFTSGNSSATNYTLTIPANTGTLSELNLAQTWTAGQTFTNSDLLLLGSSTGATTFTSANASATNYTATIPANTGTVPELNLAQTWTAAQTFTNSDILLLGSSTGATTFTSGNASATNYTATVPANTGTVSELNLAQTWTAGQTFTNSDILLLGSSTGATTFTSANASATNYTATVPANTGTLAELNIAQTFTASQNLSSGLVVSWNADTGLSRDAAATVDVGNGTAGDFSGTIKSAHATLTGLTTGTNADFLCLSAAGVVLIQTTACTISSLRFKPDWKAYDDNALSKVNALEVGTFHAAVGSRDPNSETLQAGLNAENVAKIAPECAIYEDDMKTPKSYRQECVIALLVKGMQTLQHHKEIEIPN